MSPCCVATVRVMAGWFARRIRRESLRLGHRSGVLGAQAAPGPLQFDALVVVRIHPPEPRTPLLAALPTAALRRIALLTPP